MAKTLVKKTVNILAKKRLSTVAGAWVFYFLTSVIPLVFLLITAFGVFGVEIANDIVSKLPVEFRDAGISIVSTANKASKGTTILFIFTSVYSLIRLLNQMSKDGEHIYELSSKKHGLMRRFWAFLALGSMFFIFLGCATVVAFGNKFFNFSFVQGKLKNLITAVVVTFLILLVSYSIILLLNVFISPVKMKFREVAIGGLISLSTIVLGTIGFALYVRVFNSYNAFYGSLAGVIVFLFWAYILMVAMVIGVIINSLIYEKRALKKG